MACLIVLENYIDGVCSPTRHHSHSMHAGTGWRDNEVIKRSMGPWIDGRIKEKRLLKKELCLVH